MKVMLDDARGPSVIPRVPAAGGQKSGCREGVRTEATVEEGTCYQPRDGERARAEDCRHLQSWGHRAVDCSREPPGFRAHVSRD